MTKYYVPMIEDYLFDRALCDGSVEGRKGFRAIHQSQDGTARFASESEAVAAGEAARGGKTGRVYAEEIEV